MLYKIYYKTTTHTMWSYILLIEFLYFSTCSSCRVDKDSIEKIREVMKEHGFLCIFDRSEKRESECEINNSFIRNNCSALVDNKADDRPAQEFVRSNTFDDKLGVDYDQSTRQNSVGVISGPGSGIGLFSDLCPADKPKVIDCSCDAEDLDGFGLFSIGFLDYVIDDEIIREFCQCQWENYVDVNIDKAVLTISTKCVKRITI